MNNMVRELISLDSSWLTQEERMALAVHEGEVSLSEIPRSPKSVFGCTDTVCARVFLYSYAMFWCQKKNRLKNKNSTVRTLAGQLRAQRSATSLRLSGKSPLRSSLRQRTRDNERTCQEIKRFAPIRSLPSCRRASTLREPLRSFIGGVVGMQSIWRCIYFLPLLLLITGYTDAAVKTICPRCHVISDPESGRFDLRVSSVKLGEDDRFECQVLPGPRAVVKKQLRAAVRVYIQGKSIFLGD